MESSELQRITSWLIDGTWSSKTPAEMTAEACERMVAAGLPLWRFGIFIRTLHPEIFGRNFIWRRSEEVEIGTVDFEILETPEFARSPLRVVFEQGLEVRGRMDDPGSKHFPFLDDMRAEGVTDYVAMPMPFLDGSVHATSWTTRHPGGFTDDHIAAIHAIVKPLARITEIISLRRTAEMLLDTYVGNRAGARILGGQIRRGHNDTMQAAIWLSDLRGFTALSDRLPAETVVEILNHYFDCQVAAIRGHGGEVLKFMGDGLLAVFPIDEYVGDAAHVCSRVLEAARESRASVEALPHPAGDAIEHFRFAVALHVANILYGNIGGGNRLDFTCIGPAVNLAARLEKHAASLRRSIVASAEFAAHAPGEFLPLGEFAAAGFTASQTIFGLADQPATRGLPGRADRS